MESTDRIAILLAAYNGEKYIADQLRSIKNQTYAGFRVYIHDDGSDDKTVECVRRFCEGDNRFRILEFPACGGAKENFFSLMRCVEDEAYIMFCDQDDVWAEDKISTTLTAMKKAEQEAGQDYNGSKPVCVYSDLEVTDSDLHTIDPSFYHYSGKDPYRNSFASLIMTNVAVGCTMMINRTLLDTGLMDVNHDLIFMHDWWLALIASTAGRIAYIDRCLMKYRQHADNAVGAKKKRTPVKRVVNLITRKSRDKTRINFQRGVNFSKALMQLPIKTGDEDLIHGLAKAYDHGWMYRAVFFIKNGLIPANKIWEVLWL